MIDGEKMKTTLNIADVYIDAEMSQFEEVAGTCSNKDDINEACFSLRSVSIGILTAAGMSIFHVWSNFQLTRAYISPIAVMIATYLLGHLWTLVIPKSKPFTLKEHALIMAMANVAWTFYIVFSFATAAVLPILEKSNRNFAYYLFFNIALQYLGFGLAGILRRFLVWPCEVIWPQNLPLIATLRMLHERRSPTKQKSFNKTNSYCLTQRFIDNKLLFFFAIAILSFIYEWFPLYIMPLLGFFSWMCMIRPQNRLLVQLTSTHGTALGGGALVLDWRLLTKYLGSPMILPGWALFNIAFGFVLIIWIISPILYVTNVRGLENVPIGGLIYWKETTLNFVITCTSFACIPAAFVHTILFHGSDIWTQFRTKTLDNPGNDMHARLVSQYKNVPDWCYLILFISALVMMCVVTDVAGWLSWYLVLFALFLGAILLLPFGLIASITGQFLHNSPVYFFLVIMSQTLSLGRLTYDTVVFMANSYILFLHTLALIQDMKFAHYIKIGPRSLFAAQFISGLICSTLSVGFQYMYQNSSNSHIFGYDMVIFDFSWLGSSVYLNEEGFFKGPNSSQQDLFWSFLVGGLLPVPCWILSRWTRFRWFKYVHWPLILVTIGWMPVQLTAGTLFTWIIIGIIVYLVFGRYNYNQRNIYLASAGLDLGVNITLIIVYTALLNNNVGFPEWWGNNKGSTWKNCSIPYALPW